MNDVTNFVVFLLLYGLIGAMLGGYWTKDKPVSDATKANFISKIIVTWPVMVFTTFGLKISKELGIKDD